MIRKFLLVLVVLAAVGVGVFMLLPTSSHAEHSRNIAAPTEVVFVNVNDFHAWPAWVPWEQARSEIKRTFAGPNNGLNSVYGWAGNSTWGDGQMTMTCSEVPSRICVLVESATPACTARTMHFQFSRSPDGSTVSWSIDMQLSPLERVKALFGAPPSCPAVDLESGLASLDQMAQAHVKAVAEARTTGSGPKH